MPIPSNKNNKVKEPVSLEQQSLTLLVEQKLKRSVQLGINLIDLDRMPDYVYKQMVAIGKLDADKIMTYDEEKGDERFLVLGCELLRGATLIDILRSEARQLSTMVRAYIKVGKGEWSKIGFDKVLTEQVGEKQFALSPDVFPVKVEAEEYVPPQVGRIEFKRKI